MNRIDRISAILIQLQSKRVVKAQDIASRFNISLRTVYRDIKSLDESGVPVLGEAGVGYSLMEGYRLPPVMFTREEAIAFLTAEKLVEKLTDETNGNNYRTAMMKIRAVLRTTEKDLLEEMEHNIAVVRNRTMRTQAEIINPLQKILKCVAESRVIKLRYFSNYRQEESDRFVEPIGVLNNDGFWHLIAWCRMRNDVRDFRFDRVSALEICEEYFEKRHEPLSRFIHTHYEGRELVPVTIIVDRKVYPFLTDQKYYFNFVSETISEEEVEMNFIIGSLEGFARWYMMFGDSARIITPASLAARVQEIMTGMQKNL
jgi:predicted DNA-binding transcriptional regulator YafY